MIQLVSFGRQLTVSNAKNRTAEEVGFVFPHMVPLIQAIRPVNKRFGGGRAGKWRALDQAERIDGVQCRLITADSTALRQRMWLDPTNLHSLVRWHVERNGAPLIQSDSRYPADGANRVIPQSWTTARFNPKTAAVVEKHEVSLVSVTLNQDIAPQTFQSDFPAGTLVTEETEPGAIHRYLQLENGKRRIVTAEETSRGAKYTELVRTESGDAGR